MKLKVVVSQNRLSVPRQVTKVYRVAPFGVPTGIPYSTITEEGQIIIGLGNGQVTALQAPNASGLTLVSDLAVAGLWKLGAGGGGGGGGSADLTNQTGSVQEVGTVVIHDPDNNESFKTTTVENDLRVIGVCAEEIGIASEGSVMFHGSGTVKVVGNAYRGQWLIASSTAGRAKAVGYQRPARGAIGMALTEYTGGGNGTVTALIDIDLYLGASKGTVYLLGGSNWDGSSAISTAQKMPYVTEASAVVASAALSAARGLSAGGGSSANGYQYSGFTGSAVAFEAHKMPFATETTARQSSADVVSARHSHSGGPASDCNRMFGGYTSTYTSAGYKMPYSTETSAYAASLNLSLARQALSTLTDYYGGAEAYLYIHGGTDGSYRSTCDRATMSTDTTAAFASGNLPTGTLGLAAVGGPTAGYQCGGQIAGPSLVTTTYKMPYSTGVLATVGGAALSLGRYRMPGGHGSITGYVLGGGLTASNSSVVDKLNFSTDTTAVVSGAALPVATTPAHAVSTNIN